MHPIICHLNQHGGPLGWATWTYLLLLPPLFSLYEADHYSCLSAPPPPARPLSQQLPIPPCLGYRYPLHPLTVLRSRSKAFHLIFSLHPVHSPPLLTDLPSLLLNRLSFSGICYLGDKPHSPNLSDLAECVILCTSWLPSPGKVYCRTVNIWVTLVELRGSILSAQAGHQ